MSTNRPPSSLAPRASALAAPGPSPAADRLLRALHNEFSGHTLAAYLRDLDAFSAFCGFASRVEMFQGLVRSTSGAVNGRVLEYRAAMLKTPMPGKKEPLAPATINRRLAAVRTLTKLGRMIGAIDWKVEVPNVKREDRRKTEGPSMEQLRRVIAAATDQDEAKAARDVAMIRMMFDLGLRSVEVRELDLVHVGVACVHVRGKGKRERVAVAVPDPTWRAMARWIAFRGRDAGPLFTSLDHRAGGGRITRTAYWRLIADLGDRAGVKLWPHGIRHTSITAVVKKRGLPAGVAHARHVNPATTMRYVDNKAETAAEAAAEISKMLK